MMSSQPMLIPRRRKRWCQSWRFSVTLETTWTLLTCWGPALLEVRGAASCTPNSFRLILVWRLKPCCICTCSLYIYWLVLFYGCSYCWERLCRSCRHTLMCWLACLANIFLLLKIRYWAVSTEQLMKAWLSFTGLKFTLHSINIIYLSGPPHRF